MNQFWKDMGIALVMGLIVPSLLLAASVSLTAGEAEHPAVTEPALESQPEQVQLQIPVLGDNGEITEIPIQAYLTSVLLAEMPVSFEEEALKAQSVVARTYTMRAVNGSAKHDGAAVCTDSTCCQGYMETAQFLANGGTAEDIQHIQKIVGSTDGLVLTYEGELIEATYFSCSGGATEDAVAVWGTDVPYLQSVLSPGEENATYFTDTVTFPSQEFAAKLGLSLSGDPAHWFSDVTYTAGGGVERVTIGGEVFTGTQLRKLLSLRSTAFSITAQIDSVTFHTRGFGHRVGMSQYGANAMATAGSTYPQILAHYYQGTELTTYSD